MSLATGTLKSLSTFLYYTPDSTERREMKAMDQCGINKSTATLPPLGSSLPQLADIQLSHAPPHPALPSLSPIQLCHPALLQRQSGFPPQSIPQERLSPGQQMESITLHQTLDPWPFSATLSVFYLCHEHHKEGKDLRLTLMCNRSHLGPEKPLFL